MNRYRIPALPTWITFHICCYCLLWCDTLVQLRVSSGTLGTQPIVPARKNKAMWPGKMLSHHCRTLPAALSWSSSRAQALYAAPCLSPPVFLFPRGTGQSDTVLVVQECFHNPFTTVTELSKHLLLTATVCWFQKEKVIWRDCIQKNLMYLSKHFSRC